MSQLKKMPIDKWRLINALGQKNMTLTDASVELGYSVGYMSQQASEWQMTIRIIDLLRKLLDISYDDIKPLPGDIKPLNDDDKPVTDGEGLSYKKISIAVYKANRKAYDDIEQRLVEAINRAVYNAIRGAMHEMKEGDNGKT